MLVRLHQYKLRMLLCYVLLHKSCAPTILIPVRVLLHYMVCTNYLMQTIKLLCFGYFPWDFPASRELLCCLYNLILCYQLLQCMVIVYAIL